MHTGCPTNYFAHHRTPNIWLAAAIEGIVSQRIIKNYEW